MELVLWFGTSRALELTFMTIIVQVNLRYQFQELVITLNADCECTCLELDQGLDFELDLTRITVMKNSFEEWVFDNFV